MILKFCRKHNKKLTKTAYHEVGHLLTAMLFDTDFAVNLITANKKYANSKMSNTNGGTGFTVKANTYTVDIHDKICVISLAGMCSQNLYFADIKKQNHSDIIPHYIKSPDKNMDNEGGIQDFNICKCHLAEINKSKVINQRDHLTEIMDYCFDFLSQEIVWEITKELADKLIGKWNLTLKYREVINHLKKMGMLTEFNNLKPSMINKRYSIINTKYNKAYS